VQATALLNKAAQGTGPKFRELLQQEARALTDIGNQFRIRHSETSKEALSNSEQIASEQIDFLFYRLFAFLNYVLETTGRTR